MFHHRTVVLDAPQIANASGRADKIVATGHHTVSYRETDGCYDDESVHYASFDASDPVAATIEDVTYAPNLTNATPSPGCSDSVTVSANCSRELLIAFTNGQTGATNPQRQGLNAAILDGVPPLNILQEVPAPTAPFDYSPMWDVHLERWTANAAASGDTIRQTDFSAALQQVANGNASGSRRQLIRTQRLRRQLPRGQPRREPQAARQSPRRRRGSCLKSGSQVDQRALDAGRAWRRAGSGICLSM